jgi:SPP1 gp7 family putative phage head morphogenesis protein
MMNPYDINPVARARNAAAPAAPESKPSAPNSGPPEDKTAPAATLPPAAKEKDQEFMQEVSWSETDVLQSYLPFANNPDPIVRSKGLKIYREMMQDEQVKVCVDVRIQARLSTPWEVVPGMAGNAQSEEMAEFIKACLTRMNGTFETDMEQMYSAITYGFSISEKVFEYIERGKFKGKIGLKAIKTREPYNYDFKIDAHGNLLGMIYIGMTGNDRETLQTSRNVGQNPAFRISTGSMNSLGGLTPTSDPKNMPLGTLENPFPPEKFIVYPYNPQFGNWYGRSDLLAAFKWWLMKKHGSRFWAIWLERYASPFLVAQYKRDAGLKPTQLQAIDDFIRNLSARQGVRVSDAWTITPVQFAGSTNDSYEHAIEAYNRYIAHAILFPNLLGFTGGQGSSGGSYSLGQKQFDSFLWILNKMGRDMSETVIGEQIIKQLIQINYGDDIEQEMFPKFRFVSIEDASIDVRSQIIQRLKQVGMISEEEDWVRDFLTLPKKDPSIKLPNQNELQQGQPGQPGQQPGKPADAKPADDGTKPPADGTKKPDGETKTPKDDTTKMAQFKEREPDEFEKKVRVKQFQEKLARTDEAIFKDASEAIIGMRDELIEKVKRKGLVSEEDPREVTKLTVNAKDLNDVLAKWMAKVFLDSKLGALEEMARAGMQVEIVKRFAEVSEDWNPLPPQEAIDFFNRKVTAKIVTRAGVKKVIELATAADLTFLKNRAFTVAGIVRDDILNDAKQIILNGIKRVDEPGTVSDLKDMFNKYLEQGVAVDGDLLKPHRLNTIVRTNVTEALNEGRASIMQDPDVEDFVPFFTYSAIMDERTTDYCQCMDGRIFRIERMNELKPPAHFNCRSFVVPITQFEVDRSMKTGNGIEVSDSCVGRSSGFSEKKVWR